MIQVQFQVFGVIQRLDMKIVGSFELFPSWYPEADGPLFVGNLEYMFEMLGSEFPYSVWLKLEPGVDPVMLEDGFSTAGLTTRWSAPAETIIASQESPQRQGLFGLLTVGYGAAALLTVVGFLLYAMFSFRRRFIELGVLRAIGLSTKQMTRFLAWELLFLILMGGVMGTIFGVQMSNMFIPYLQVGSGEAANIPPYQVVIAWPPILRIYALFGVLLLVALVVLVLLLRRMKIFQAIKLGETV
jgi:putative ABC transport system permease protein